MIAKSTERAVPVEVGTNRLPPNRTFTAEELFALARNKSADGRRALFSTVCDLFLGESLVLSDRECNRRRENPSVKRPVCPVAPE
jgi:hypothetical protein